MLTVTLYMRQDCHLCEQARADLESLQEQIPHRLVDITVGTQVDTRQDAGPAA